MDAMGMILLTVPILFPVAESLGFNPIWFGIIIVRVFEMASITPPVGMNVFVLKGVAKDVPLGTIFRGIIPFLIADFFHVTLLVAVPQVALFLPNLMM
jgi:TRAP-type C4-dicarboxylate transport system permease large subunit